MSQRRRGSLAFLTSGVLALPLLAGCSASDGGGPAASPPDIQATVRDLVADGGVMRWAVDSLPDTLNAYQADADATTGRIAGAVLPALFTLDDRGRPVANPDYLEKAEVTGREPKQVVVYKLNQQAVWSDGREIGAADFVSQWRALSGRDSAFWTARNAGYDRIEKIERGANDLEVKVTFAKPYADWRSLFSPLYPKQVTGTPDAFNEGARGALKVTAGPFTLGAVDKGARTVTLSRNPRWWGKPAKLDTLVLTAVPRAERAAALAAGKLDIAEIDRATAERITLAVGDAPGGAAGTPAHGSGARTTTGQAARPYDAQRRALAGYRVRRSLEPVWTQLALNGSTGPLADERVRRAVARALDRQDLADLVLRPLGLPAKPVGSHLALAGQRAYADNSDALGGQDPKAAQALLADAGWRRGAPLSDRTDGARAGSQATGEERDKKDDGKTARGDGTGNDGLYIVGDDKNPDGKNPQGKNPGGGAADAKHPARAATQYRVFGAPALAHGAGHGSAADPGRAAVPEGGYRSRPDGEAVGADTAGELRGGPALIAPAPLAALQGASLVAQAEAAAQADAAGARDDGKKRAEEEPAAPADGKDPAAGARAVGEPQAGAYAPQGTPAPAPAKQVRTSGNLLAKDGRTLSLRFVLPSGPGSEQLRAVGDRISQMLLKIGISTEVTKVADDSFFKDHIASGQYDLALYSWPATAFPATDARPIFAKPEPAADGSLLIEQNYTRVGTDHIDQLFDQALGELDEDEARELMKKADARIWAAAGSIPLFQRPELVAVKAGVVNAGAFGLGAPHYQDIGWKKAGAAGAPKNKG
ncbi:ABC transporter family substrate-binding protein [Streptomyces sp. NRRL S-87]|uniref:ABC transporter family substrate-binding protein n=1 Tax=Streptomyces sp. NRRL S-87 TaxID=1463920 RepID=UPI0004BF5784|nr:ABC transporter family substrate-binding protein [Streptomyces sp. NRRL S-87]